MQTAIAVTGMQPYPCRTTRKNIQIAITIHVSNDQFGGFERGWFIHCGQKSAVANALGNADIIAKKIHRDQIQLAVIIHIGKGDHLGAIAQFHCGGCGKSTITAAQ